MGEQDWQNAGARWQGKDGRLRLEGWSRYRRIVILQRRIERDLTLSEATASRRQLHAGGGVARQSGLAPRGRVGKKPEARCSTERK